MNDMITQIERAKVTTEFKDVAKLSDLRVAYVMICLNQIK